MRRYAALIIDPPPRSLTHLSLGRQTLSDEQATEAKEDFALEMLQTPRPSAWVPL